jgi:DUF2971 family protein
VAAGLLRRLRLGIRNKMSKRVYKFMKAEHAVGCLQNKRLKLSTIDDLNDPFDLCPLDTSDPDISKAVDAVIINFRAKNAIVCFSRNWDNLLLWSHYGDSHQGVCLGFDIPAGEPGQNYDTDVLYQPNLLQIRGQADINLDLADRLHRTKHESWSYEQEVRMFIRLNDPPDANNLRWVGFGSNIVLKEVIIGAQCHPEVSKGVAAAAIGYGDAVQCSWAGMRTDAFLLVKLHNPPDWHASVT